MYGEELSSVPVEASNNDAIATQPHIASLNNNNNNLFKWGFSYKKNVHINSPGGGARREKETRLKSLLFWMTRRIVLYLKWV